MAARLLPVVSALFLLAGCAARRAPTVAPLERALRNVEAAPTFVEIDVSALRHNTEEFKRLLGGKQKLCAVVKTDAYSLGVELVAPAVVAGGADYLCAVYNSEFQTIRHLGIRTPIIRIAVGTQDEVTQAVQIGGIEENVGSLEQAKMISDVALSFRKTRGKDFRIPVHIEINMSMTRMDVVQAKDIQEIVDLPGIQVRGLMSHFANASDEKLVHQDMDKFEQMIANVKLRDPVLIHLAATSATVLFPETRRDLVRIGSGILSASNPLRATGETEPRKSSLTLWPTTVSVKSHVALIMRDVPVGSPVGYGSTYATEKPANLATVRFGHSNGYPSAAANHGWVLIRGKRFPIVGRLSQNVTNIDITNENPQDPVRVGDEVVLLGPQGDDRITIPELQAWAREGAGAGAVPSVSTNLFLLSNPHKTVEGVASKLPVRHLTCGLCLELNFSGSWAGDLPVQDNLARMTWTLTQNNNTVTGPVRILMPTGVVLLDGTLSGRLSGTPPLSGSTLTYTIDVSPGGIPSQPACTGQLGGTATAVVGQASTLPGSYAVRSSSCTTQFLSGSFTLTKQ